MSGSLGRSVAVEDLFERRTAPLHRVADDAAAIADACHAMALRFHRGGTLRCFGNGAASTDAQHVSVEFVHPVIVGKRALPAVSLTADVATMTGIVYTIGLDEVFAHQLRQFGTPHDIALGLSVDGCCGNVVRGLEAAKEIGMLTVALVGGDGGTIAARSAADHILVARTDDPRVIKEVHVTIYHILWELVHVIFEQPGLLTPEVLA